MTTTARRLTVTAPDGALIAVLDHPAPGGDAEGPTLVLAHGWCSTTEVWDPVVAELQRRRPHLRVVTYDQPGHGRSTPGRDRRVSLLDLGTTLREVIAETVPEGDVVLGGHSMGGMTIMALAQVDPSLIRRRIRGVALVGTAAHLDRRAIRGEALAMGILSKLPATARGLPSTARLTAANLFGPEPDPVAVRTTMRMTTRTRANVVADWHRAIGELDFREHLAPFAEVRTAVVTGRVDRLTPVSAGRRLAAGIPGADLWIVPRTGHMVLLEVPAVVADKIELLLDAEPTSQRA